MGDGINKITNIEKVNNRGVFRGKAGKEVGVGKIIYDEIVSSGINTVVIPGLHRNIMALDPRFRALYSHCASAEKVSLGYHSYLKIKADNIIISDISSNTVTIGIKNKCFFGAMDACIGAPGFIHGPLDLKALRMVDEGYTTANEAFYSSGIMKASENDVPANILTPKNDKQKLILESLIMSIKMEINGFLALINPNAFVLTGWAGLNDSIFKDIQASFEKFAPVYKLGNYAAAKGSAEIARDILQGQKSFLGIKVDF
tara:strand:+ start:442 stop:1215 length:774 start_codon:yes stop_codon:yes gene_type:complete